jgi:hypothetical protein
VLFSFAVVMVLDTYWADQRTAVIVERGKDCLECRFWTDGESGVAPLCSSAYDRIHILIVNAVVGFQSLHAVKHCTGWLRELKLSLHCSSH